MLSYICGNDCIAISNLIYLFHNIWSVKYIRSILHRELFFIFLKMCKPVCMIKLFKLGIYSLKYFKCITNN